MYQNKITDKRNHVLIKKKLFYIPKFSDYRSFSFIVYLTINTPHNIIMTA